LYVAAGLQRLPLHDRWPIAERLIAHGEDANDHNLPLMVWYGVEPLAAADPNRAVALISKCKLPVVRQYIARRAVSGE
jgi:hypothetical protein